MLFRSLLSLLASLPARQGEREGLTLPVSEGDEVSLGVTEVEALLDCDLVVDSEELFDALVDWLGERVGLKLPVSEGDEVSLGVTEVEVEALLDCDLVVDSDALFEALADRLAERERLTVSVELKLGVSVLVREDVPLEEPLAD